MQKKLASLLYFLLNDKKLTEGHSLDRDESRMQQMHS